VFIHVTCEPAVLYECVHQCCPVYLPCLHRVRRFLRQLPTNLSMIPEDSLEQILQSFGSVSEKFMVYIFRAQKQTLLQAQRKV